MPVEIAGSLSVEPQGKPQRQTQERIYGSIGTGRIEFHRLQRTHYRSGGLMHRPWLMAGISIFALASTSANSGDVKLADRIVGTWKLVAVDESADEKQWTKRPLPGNITKTFTADGQIKWSVQPNSAEKSKDRKPGAPPHPSVGGNYSINEADRTLLYRLGRSPLLPSSQGEAPIAISLSENRLEERVPLSGQLSIGPTPRFLRTRWERTPS